MSRVGPRWWMIAAMAFAAIDLGIYPVAMLIFWNFLLAFALGGSPMPQQWLLGLFILVVVPGLLAAGAATLVEWVLKRSGRPDRAKRWSWRTVVTFLFFVSPVVFLPALFSVTLANMGGTSEEREARRRHAQSPIGSSDSAGFCSVPHWTIVDGRPQLKVAVRVPERGSYGLMVQGAFARQELPSERGRAYSESGLTGLTIRDLGPGVDTMTVELESGGPIEWPVRITYVDFGWADGQGTIDSRAGDSLYILDSTGVRVSR